MKKVILLVMAVAMVPAVARAVTPLDTTQPSLALTFGMETLGIYGNLGTIEMFPSNFPIGLATNGDLLAINQNIALFSQLGTTFGGDGVSTFALPDLNGKTMVGTGTGPGLSSYILGQNSGSTQVTLGLPNMPVSVGGGGQPFNTIQPSMGIYYMIATAGIFPSQGGGGASGTDATPLLGQVFPTAAYSSQQSPVGFAACNGQLLPISQNTALYEVIGTTYGGDGITTFALPDLRGRTVVGTGQGPGLSNYVTGQTGGTETTTVLPGNLPAPNGPDNGISNLQPFLAMNYIIAETGIFPSPGSSNGASNSVPYLGQISLFAGTFAPSGWAFCAGQTLPIQQNTALFSLLGTFYGGDGITNFKLPDLRGRVAVGGGGNLGNQGTQSGTERLFLTGEQIPVLPTLPEPASLSLLAVGAVGMLMRRRISR